MKKLILSLFITLDSNNKKTKESNLAVVLFVILVTAICIGILYYFFWI